MNRQMDDVPVALSSFWNSSLIYRLKVAVTVAENKLKFLVSADENSSWR